jgi:ribosomal protein S18 acetylase RimI-like enzyme
MSPPPGGGRPVGTSNRRRSPRSEERSIEIRREWEDTWTVVRGDEVLGTAWVLDRPDGRRFLVLRDVVDAARGRLLRAVADDVEGPLHLTVDEQDDATLRDARAVGFAVARREHCYAVPTTGHGDGGVVLPDGIVLRSLSDVDADAAAVLDTRLRQDVPGSDGWRTTSTDLREDLASEPYDPETYLIAVEESTGEHVGLVRVWWNRSGPRLGLIGVVAAWRGRGLGAALLRQVLAVVAQRGHPAVETEADASNDASNGLLRAFGAERVGGAVYLTRQ